MKNNITCSPSSCQSDSLSSVESHSPRTNKKKQQKKKPPPMCSVFAYLTGGRNERTVTHRSPPQLPLHRHLI